MLQIVLLASGIGIVGWAIFIYNRLVGLRNAARGAWSDIDVQLKRRHDLVDNLVEAVRGYARHERTTLEEVVRARTRAESARATGGATQAGDAAAQLGGPLRRLFAVAESYPDLQASRSFLELQQALIDVENDLQNARRYYNAVVRDLNSRIQSFPDMLIAGPSRFEAFEFFQLDAPEEAAAPRIDLESVR